MKHSLPVAAVASLFILCPHAYAEINAGTLRSLQAADAAFSNGTYSSSARVAEFAEKKSTWRLQKRVALMRGQKFEFLEVDTHADGKPLLTVRSVFDGQDKVRWIEDGVDISRGVGDSLSPIYGLVSLQPGPCLFQGRGLSRMKIHSLSRDPASAFWILKARAADGSEIKAWLDPQARYLARRIERTDEKNQSLAHIEMQGSLAGGLLPARSVVSHGSSTPDIYVFSNAQFPTKKNISFNGTFVNPALITDDRLKTAIAIKKITHKPTTMADLLVMTEDQTAQLRKFKEEENAAETRQLWTNRALKAFPLLLAGAILFWRPRRKKAAMQSG